MVIAAMQSQLVCRGCKTTLLYPRGAANVCCAVCNVVTTVPPGIPYDVFPNHNIHE